MTGHITHGGARRGAARDPEYVVWQNMKKRCYYHACKSYADYGGRGIKVCARWLNSYLNFLSDMGSRPSPKHTLERVKNDRNYSPANCRWATRTEQMQNTRMRRDALTIDGRYLKHVAKERGISYETARWRFLRTGKID